MIVLGINAYHGDASAAILVDGQLVAAAEEERFVRSKHWAGFPRHAVEYCLAAANARVEDIDHIAIGRNPRAHLLDKVIYTLVRRPSTKLVAHRLRNTLKVRDPKAELASVLEVDPRRIRATGHNVEHHLAHISSAFFASPYDESAIVSVDGCGDFVSTMWGTGRGGRLEIANRVAFPHSLGFFYSGISQYLGFPKFGDEYKVMGLSAYGEPDVVDKIRQLVIVKGDGDFELGLDYFQHHTQGIAMTWEGEPRYETINSAEARRPPRSSPPAGRAHGGSLPGGRRLRPGRLRGSLLRRARRPRPRPAGGAGSCASPAAAPSTVSPTARSGRAACTTTSSSSPPPATRAPRSAPPSTSGTRPSGSRAASSRRTATTGRATARPRSSPCCARRTRASKPCPTRCSSRGWPPPSATARSSAGSRGAWSGGRGPWATAASSWIRAAPR